MNIQEAMIAPDFNDNVNASSGLICPFTCANPVIERMGMDLCR